MIKQDTNYKANFKDMLEMYEKLPENLFEFWADDVNTQYTVEEFYDLLDSPYGDDMLNS